MDNAARVLVCALKASTCTRTLCVTLLMSTHSSYDNTLGYDILMTPPETLIFTCTDKKLATLLWQANQLILCPSSGEAGYPVGKQ